MDDAYSNKPTSPKDKRSTIESMRSENMNYIDSSDVIVEYYKNQTASGLDRYFLEIEEWLDQDKQLHENTPLVLEADDGIGKKTLLVKWMEYHSKNKKGRYPDYIIPHFATQSGKNSNYFYAIYRILVKLRETLNVKQKVELLEEKLRRYFHYWLEICSRELDSQIVNGAKVIYDKVILIFEGIDNFRDMLDVHREANVSFWLPKYFPKNIKVIVTAEKNSNSMRILKPSCQIIPIVSDQKIIKQMINNHLSKQLFVGEDKINQIKDIFICFNQRVRNQPLFVRTFLSVFLPYPTEGVIDLREVDQETVETVIKEINLDKLQNIKFMEELEKIYPLKSTQELEKLMNQKSDLEKVQSPKSGEELEKFKQLKNLREQKKLFNLNSVEELFEFQLNYFSQQFIFSKKEKDLKQDPKFIKVLMVLAITQKGLTYKEIQIVCEIEDKQWKLFLVFFKVFLMKHRELWIIHNEIFKKVVIEKYHNKEAIILHDKIAETIDKHTNNSIRKLEEETFHLFMASNHFRLKEVISIIENFLLLFNPNNKYDLCRYWQKLEENGFDPVLEYNKAVEGFQIHYHPTAEDLFRIIIQLSRFMKEFGDFETKNTPQFKHPPIIGTLQDLYDIGLIQEILKLDLYFNKDPEYQSFDPQKHLKRVCKPYRQPVLSKMESLNVEIAQNRQEVRNHYLTMMTVVNEFTENEEIEQITSLEINQFKQYIQKHLTKLLQVKKESLSGEEEDNGERESTDYYYKRWIWIQFPWACLSIQKSCDYSKTIKHCFSSATDYMSVDEEHAYTNSALKIAMEAKLKKKLMYDSNVEENSGPMLIIPQASILTTRPPNQVTEDSQFQEETGRFDRSKMILPKILNPSEINHQDHLERTMFITQDFTDFETLNKEAKLLKVSGSVQVLDGQSTVKLLEKNKDKKQRAKQFQSHSVSLKAYQQTEIFPILKTDINSHSSKQLGALQNQAKNMRRKLDTLTYENLQLAKHLKQQKIIDFNKGYIKKEISNLEELKQEKKEYDNKIALAEKEFKSSTLQKQRVKTITKICKDNKQTNEESIRFLNYLINNFKKLIKFEQTEGQKHKQEIKILYRTIDDFLITYSQKKNHQRDLLVQIGNSLKQKQNLDSLFQNSDTYIQEKAMNSIQNLRRNQAKQDTEQQQKLNKQQQQKEDKQISESLEQFEKKYSVIKDVFDIKLKNYNQSHKFLDFMANREKKSELEIILYEQRQKLEDVIAKKEQLTEQLRTYQNAYQIKNQDNIQDDENSGLQSTDRQSKQDNTLQLALDQLNRLQILRVKCYSSFDSLHTKFGCAEQNQLFETIRKRKQLIIDKEGQEAYQKILLNEFDMNAVFKKLAPYHQVKVQSE